MTINWDVTEVTITLTGRSHWMRGEQRGWSNSIEEHDIFYVFKGSGELLASSRRVASLRPGTCVWLRRGEMYQGWQDPEDPVCNHYIHFELIESGAVRSYDRPQPPELLTPADSAVIDAIMRRVTELLPFYDIREKRRFAEDHVLIAETLLRGLLMELDFSSSTGSQREESGTRLHHVEVIMKVIAIVQEQQGPVPTVRELAEHAGYSTEHFSRVFRAVIGHAPEEYLIRHRIERAKLMLTGSSLSIQEIAMRLGYQQANFFSTQFRRRIGVSPRDYRRAPKEAAAVH